MKEIYIRKNDGSLQLYDPNKINEKALYACEGLSGVSASEVVMNTSIKISDKTKSSNIQLALIQSAAELISEQNPNYEIVAGRLLNQKLRKEVYNSYTPKDFYSEIVKRVELGYYDSSILSDYTKEEIDYYGTKIKYHLDESLPYIAMSQLYYKYLIKYNKKPIETPQEVYMLMNMYIFAKSKDRKKWILEGYKALSTREVSFPTPVMNGLRSKYKKFISCNVLDAGDSIKSLSLANARILEMTSAKSGIGLNMSRVRGLGADIDNGRITHTGLLPILKAFEAGTSSMQQSSIRGGSSTVTHTWYHYEIELLVQLKNTRGTAETRCRHQDISIILNKYFLEKALNKEDIYLFHANKVPGLYEALGDYDKFKELYEKYSKTVPKESKKKINAYSLLDLILFERSFTGRVYIVFADNAIKGPWKQPVYNSNLCQEIFLPNTPLDGSLGEPEIASCILACFNHGYLTDDRVPVVAEYLVRFLNLMIDYGDYDIPEVEYSAKKRRTLGIGHSDMFHYLAKNKKFYNTSEGREFIHDRIELSTYYMLLTSINLVDEFGACELFKDTKYSEGWLPFDEFKSNRDNNYKLKLDWEPLRKLLKEKGAVNSTLSAVPPTGNSSKLSNSTAGVEPPRYLVTVKDDKNFKFNQLVPDFYRYKNYYTTAWGSDFNNNDYFKFISIIQKFVDQSISTNQYTNTVRVHNNQIKMSEAIQEILTAYRYGLKTLYYQNFLTAEDSDGIAEEDDSCGSGGCQV